MATKGELFIKQQPFASQNSRTANNSNQYSSLSHNPKFHDLSVLQSCSKLYNDKYCDIKETDNSGENQHMKSCLKSVGGFSSNVYDDKGIQKHWKENDSLNSINKSTLSFHISAYENSAEAFASVSFERKQNLIQILLSSAIITDALQFSRHTESEIMTKEIMHFKTTQKLFKHETEILTRTNLMPSFDSNIISCRSQTGTASTKNSGKAVAKETRQSTEVGDKKNSNSNKQKPNLPNDDGSSSEDEEKKEELEKECGTNKTKRKKKPEKNTEKEQKQKSIEKDVLLANRKNLDNIDDDRTQEDNSMRTKNVPQSVVDSESNKPRQALHSGLTKEQIASTRAEDSTQEGSLKNPTDEKKVDKSVDLKQIIKDISREYIQWTSTKRKRLSEFLKTTAAYNADQFKFIEDTSLLTEMEEKKFIELFGTKQMKTLIAIPVSKTATTATNASASQSTPSITVPDVSKINLNETEAPNPTIDSSPPLYTCSSLDRTQISSPTIGQTVSTPQLPNSRLNRNQVLLERRKQRTDNTESSEDQSSNDTTMRDVPSIPADSAISMIVNTNGSPTTETLRQAIINEQEGVQLAADLDAVLEILGNEYDKLFEILQKISSFLEFRDTLNKWLNQYKVVAEDQGKDYKNDFYLLVCSYKCLKLQFEETVNVSDIRFEEDFTTSASANEMRDKLDVLIYEADLDLQKLNSALDCIFLTRELQPMQIPYQDCSLPQSFDFNQEWELRANKRLEELLENHQKLLKIALNASNYVNTKRDLMGRKLFKLRKEHTVIPSNRAQLLTQCFDLLYEVLLVKGVVINYDFNTDNDSITWTQLTKVRGELESLVLISKRVNDFLSSITLESRVLRILDATNVVFKVPTAEDFAGPQ